MKVESHSTLFKTKQHFHRTVVLFERPYCRRWCNTCFTTKTHIFQQAFASGFCIINGIYSRLLLHFLTIMLHTLQTRICSFKGKHTCFNACASKMALFPKPCCSNSRIDSILQNSILYTFFLQECCFARLNLFLNYYSMVWFWKECHLSDTFIETCVLPLKVQILVCKVCNIIVRKCSKSLL